MPSMPLITTYSTSSDKKIDSFTDMMRSLTLLVHTLQGNTSALSVMSQPKPQLANASFESRMRIDYRGAGSGKNWPERVNKYIYCWKTDHYLKRHCQVF